VQQATRELMERLGYRGILDCGWRYDARDGRYKLLDVNPRLGTTFRLFVDQSGLDVARALYLDLTGQPVRAAAPSRGRRWLVESHDFASSWRLMRDGWLSAGDWFASFRGVEELAWLAGDDPAPFLGMLLASARRSTAAARRGRRLP